MQTLPHPINTENLFNDGCLVNFAANVAEQGFMVAIAPSKKAVRIVSVDQQTETAHRHKIDADAWSNWSMTANGDIGSCDENQLMIADNCVAHVDTPLVTVAGLVNLCHHAKVAVRPSKTGLRVYAAKQDRIFKLRALINGEMQFKSWMVGEEEPQIEDGDVVLGGDFKDDDEVNFSFFADIVMGYDCDGVTH